MPSIQGIYYYFYAFYRRHNHISIKVTLRSVSKMEAKGVLYQLIRLRLYPQNLIRVMPTQG